MGIKDLIYRTRTYRRFDESQSVDMKVLEGLVDLARLSASGANRQPLKYLIYNKTEDCKRIFPLISWAGYLPEWPGPDEGERPTAYIVILGDKSISEVFGIDHGIASQSIMLGATEAGLGGCIIATIKKDVLANELSIPEKYEVLLILALGKTIEKVIIDEIKNNDVKYWRDADKTHHVPKRSLKDIILKL
jgi:nitroreductase